MKYKYRVLVQIKDKSLGLYGFKNKKDMDSFIKELKKRDPNVEIYRAIPVEDE